ncbi:MAG: MerR family DNA-binding transcriptional regulator [Alphaproteobacteria bacterium]
MNVSQLARRAGLSPSGVRWYESVGILPKHVRRRNGYREYTDADLGRLLKAAKRVGAAMDAVS